MLKHLIDIGADGTHPSDMVKSWEIQLQPRAMPKKPNSDCKESIKKRDLLVYLLFVPHRYNFRNTIWLITYRNKYQKSEWQMQVNTSNNNNNKCEKNCSKNWWEYQARMVDKPSNSTFAGGINDMLFINPKKVASTFVLYFSSRLVLNFTFISDTKPHNLAHILNHLQMNVVCCIIYLQLRSKLSGIALANTCIYLFLILFINK